MAFHEELGVREDGSGHLDFIGKVNSRGFAVGSFWTSGGFSDSSPLNNGFLYGPLDDKGEVAGSSVVFIYPDMRTALFGSFRAGQMVSSRPTEVIAERCADGFKRVLVAEPEPDAPEYKYSAGNEIRVSGDQPGLVDPYERRTVYIGDVSGAGEGVFAKRFIPSGETFAYYGGNIYNVTKRPVYYQNMTTRE